MMIRDASSGRIQDRVKYVTEVWRGTFEDYQCRHFVHRTLCSIVHGELIAAESNVLVTYTDVRGRSGVLATGTYHDQIALKAEGGARFRSKRVILDTGGNAPVSRLPALDRTPRGAGRKDICTPVYRTIA